jgi:hypothetical protein
MQPTTLDTFAKTTDFEESQAGRNYIVTIEHAIKTISSLALK